MNEISPQLVACRICDVSENGQYQFQQAFSASPQNSVKQWRKTPGTRPVSLGRVGRRESSTHTEHGKYSRTQGSG